MKTKNIIGVSIVVLAVAAAVFFVTKKPAVAPEVPETPEVTETIPAQEETTTGGETTGGTTASSGYTMAAIASHKSSASCWSAIEGNVYDLTMWVNKHPGGKEAIISLCGKDGTSAFLGQHGGDGRATSVLAGFKLGAVQK